MKDVDNEYDEKLSEVKRMLNVELDQPSIKLVNSGIEERRKELLKKFVIASEEEKNDLSKRNNNLTEKINTLSDENATMREELVVTNEKLAATNEKNDEITKKYNNLLSVLESMGITDMDFNP